MGAPDQLIYFLRNLYACKKEANPNIEKTDSFKIGKEVNQGCILLPCLFNSYADLGRFNTVQSLNHDRLFVTPWTAAHQASLSITNSQSLFKLMYIKSMMPSNHLILCHPLLLLPSFFPGNRVFLMSHFLASGGQNIGASASATVLPMNIQD